jgi:glyoxylase-like metal-dependent hydrolase (beta-lactamase superfamily II)
MEVTSESQFRSFRSNTVAPAEFVRDGVVAVAMAMNGSLLVYSLCYVVDDGSGGIHVIDPGSASEENEQRLIDACGLLGRDVADIATITVTHLHPDHLGLAERVRELSGAPLIMHVIEEQAMRTLPTESRDTAADSERWGVPLDRRAAVEIVHPDGSQGVFPVVDRTVASGDLLPIPGRKIRVVHTPGHTSGHMCLHDADTGLVWSGDHALPTIHSGIGFGASSGSNPIEDYLDALRRLRVLDDNEVLPGHENRFRGLAERCESISAHHLRRTREVAEAVGGGRSVWDIAQALTWTAGWENLRDVERLSALRQTEMHLRFVASGAADAYLRS